MADQLGGQVVAEFGREVAAALALALHAQRLEKPRLGVEIERDRLALAPEGRDLQNCRARETPMGEKRGLLEYGAVAGGAYGQGGAREGREGRVGKGEGHQRRA